MGQIWAKNAIVRRWFVLFREFDGVVHLFCLFKVDIRIEHENLRRNVYMAVWHPAILWY